MVIMMATTARRRYVTLFVTALTLLVGAIDRVPRADSELPSSSNAAVSTTALIGVVANGLDARWQRTTEADTGARAARHDCLADSPPPCHGVRARSVAIDAVPARAEHPERVGLIAGRAPPSSIA